jgi:hypothetical protein
MAVQFREDKLLVTTMTFEARYSEGYRYLDHCGETLVRLRAHDRRWEINRANPSGTNLRNAALEMLLLFDNDRIALSVQRPFDFAEAEKKSRSLGNEAQALYEIVVGSLRVPETTRVGVRFRYAAPADSLEEADGFVSRGLKSPLLDTILSISSAQLVDASAAFVVEEPSRGYRRRIAIESEVQLEPGEVGSGGLGTEEGRARVAIDVDAFTRPESGHFPNSSRFIQESYLRARTISLDIFRWLQMQQGSRS